MHLKEQKSNASNSGDLDGQLKGKSMAAPAFSLQASAGDDGASGGPLDGRLSLGGDGVDAVHTEQGDFMLGSLENAGIGAGAGAVIGAGVGSMIPGVGTAIGAGVGAVLGGIAGAFVGNGPSLEHTTVAKAGDRSADTRKKVGVGESVIFRSDTDGLWTASSGAPANQAAGKVFMWTAPNAAGNATIKIKSGDKETSVTMEVLEPQSMTTEKIDEIAYPAGSMGAGMHLYFDYHPMTVSFANVEAGEVSGPASNVTGYFAALPAAAIYHNSGDNFFSIGGANRLNGQDTAAGSGLPAPWSDGGLQWLIPNRFKVAGEAGAGKVFHTMTQSFALKADGEFTVTKGGQSVTRKP